MEGEPLYWIKPLESEFSVKVNTCKKSEEGFEITLSSNVIRPAGGGQAGDRGILKWKENEIQILDTIEREGETILLIDKSIDVGATPTLLLDLKWRRRMMRNHTSEHILVAILADRLPNLGLGYIWIDGNHGTVEIQGEDIAIEHLFTAEKEVQKIIMEDLEVHTEIVDPESIDPAVRAREGVTEKHTAVRLVKIGDIDVSACSGIHVTHTRDIGFFKIIDYKFENNQARIEFITGEDAINIVSKTFNRILERKDVYPFEIEQIGYVLDRSKKIIDERKDLSDKMEQLLAEGPSIEDVRGVTFRHEYLSGFDSKELKRFIMRVPVEGASAILFFSAGEKCNFIFRTNKLPKDAHEYVSSLIEIMGGRGGGSKQVYTGGFAEVSDSKEAYEKLVAVIREHL
ncbi:MAG: hypothetical protein ACW97A_08730 [Candidatus Thorarchaeota archaeon]|jgi:alanyl-tRNA synthetase